MQPPIPIIGESGSAERFSAQAPASRVVSPRCGGRLCMLYMENPYRSCCCSSSPRSRAAQLGQKTGFLDGHTKLMCTAALWVNPLAAHRSSFVCAINRAQKHTSLPAAQLGQKMGLKLLRQTLKLAGVGFAGDKVRGARGGKEAAQLRTAARNSAQLHTTARNCTQLHATARNCAQLHATAQLHTTVHNCAQLHTTAHNCTQLHTTAHNCTLLRTTARYGRFFHLSPAARSAGDFGATLRERLVD